MNQPEPTPGESFQAFSRLSLDTLVYGLGGVLAQLLSLATVPILARIISVADFGVVDLINTTTSFFSILFGSNLMSGLFRFYYEPRAEHPIERRKLVSSNLWFLVLFSLPLALVVSFFAPQISEMLFSSQRHSLAIRLAVWAIPSSLVYTFAISLQRLQRRPGVYMALNLGYSVVYVGLIILLMAVLRMGIESIFITQLVGYTLFGLIGLWAGRRLLGLIFSRYWFGETARFALPLFPGTLIGWWLSASNRFFLNGYTSTEQLGYYSLATKIASALALLVQAFRLAWDPFALSILNKPYAKKSYATAYQSFLLLTLAVAALLTSFAREAVLVFATSLYLPAVALVGVLAARQVLQGLNNIVRISVAISKKTLYSSLGLGVGALANLAANLLLTPRFGTVGAAFAELSGYLASLLAFNFISQRVYPVAWNLRLTTQLLAGFAVLASLSLWASTALVPWLAVPLKFLLLLAYWAFLLRFIAPDQRAGLVNMVRQAMDWLAARRAARTPGSRPQGGA